MLESEFGTPAVWRGKTWLGALAAWLLIASAAVAQAPWVETGADGAVRVHLYFFWSETCPHCLKAHPFIKAIPNERPWVIVHSLEVSHQRDNARRFIALAESLGQTAEAVPTLIACGVMEVGWDDAASTGAALLRRLDECRTQALQGTATPDAAAPAEPLQVRMPLFGEVAADSLSLPAFTVVLAGLDAFNPCAFFVLLFLLSLLAHQKNRRRMAVIGGIFVLTSGLMYFAFMAAWLNVFELLGALAWITLAAGLLAIAVGLINIKDFFAFEQGITLSIPESRKPDLYRRARAILNAENLPAMVGATVLLATAANFYELLCTAGFPMVYTRLLTLSDLSPGARYAYLAFYNLIYVLPLALIVFAFVRTLGARKLSEREGRLLKLLSGVMMLELGLLLVIAPALLSNLWVSAALLAVAVGVTALAARLTPETRERSSRGS
ncbi:MAG: thioredoxin family protein [Candidatus Contendobacter sp.]|nr:thioredoxin family protein [Candidatus Contendobacter sp.]